MSVLEQKKNKLLDSPLYSSLKIQIEKKKQLDSITNKVDSLLPTIEPIDQKSEIEFEPSTNDQPSTGTDREHADEIGQSTNENVTKVSKNEPFVRQIWFKIESSDIPQMTDRLYETIIYTNGKEECGLCAHVFKKRYQIHKNAYSENNGCCICRQKWMTKNEFIEHIKEFPMKLKCCSCAFHEKKEPNIQNKNEFLDHSSECFRKRHNNKRQQQKRIEKKNGLAAAEDKNGKLMFQTDYVLFQIDC